MKKVMFLTNLIVISAALGMQNNLAEDNRDSSQAPMSPFNANNSLLMRGYELFTDRDWVAKIVRMRLNGEDFNAPQNADEQTILICATKYADCKIMQLVLNAKDVQGHRLIDVNAEDKNGNTALSIAAKAGDNEKILLLLKNGADVELAKNKVSKEARENLENLCVRIKQDTGVLLKNLLIGNIDMAKSVLGSPYININIRGRDDGASILQMCADDGLTKQVSLLLTHPDIDINAKNKDGNTALMDAVYINHQGVVCSLLRHPKIDVNLQNNHGDTALMCAVYNNHQEIVKLLLDHRDIKINVQDNLGLSALMHAVLAGNSEIVKLLLNCKDIDVNLQDGDGKTALIRSAEGGNQEIVNLLLKDSRISLNDDQKSEMFRFAIHSGHVEVVNLFLQKGIDINKRYSDGYTALMYAAESGNARMVNLLLKQEGINIEAENDDGKKALDLANEGNRRSISRLIGVKTGRQNQQFNPFIEKKTNPLSSEEIEEKFIQAVSEGDINEMDSLLEGRDDNGIKNIVDARNKNGDTPLIIASDNGNLEAVRSLLQYKADLSLKDANGDNSLIRAAKKGHFDVVEELLFRKANIINSAGQHGRTPLMAAAENGHIRVVKLLLKKGAKSSVKDSYGKTALDIVNKKIEELNKLKEPSGNYESIKNILENHNKQSERSFDSGAKTGTLENKWEIVTDKDYEKDLKEWEKNDPKIYNKIKELVENIKRDPFRGLGRPERLTGNLEGAYSRRITDGDRLIYEADGEKVILKSCKRHYEKEKRN